MCLPGMKIISDVFTYNFLILMLGNKQVEDIYCPGLLIYTI